MPYRFVPMTIDYAAQSMRWAYEGLDEVYGHDPENPHDIAELDPASWTNRVFAALDETDGYAGIFQIEESEGLLTIEVYLRPDLTGKGLGETFLRAGLHLCPARVRLPRDLCPPLGQCRQSPGHQGL